jgi:pimeloyl-ACP methyl ester carboxylesterase
MKRSFFPVMGVVLLAALPVTGHAQGDVPRFEPSDCPTDVPDDPPIDCGYLVVPEDYDDPAGATVRLPVITIHNRSGDPAPDPLLFTDGGPGYSSLGSIWWLADSAYVEERDVVILEQRGNLYAEPGLACGVSVWWEEGEGNTPCLDGLLGQGIDLTNYTTRSIVEDIDALRRVLDYDEWNLYGTSYSTKLMLLTMHLHPEGIRSVVLQSVVQPTEIGYEHDPEYPARALNVMFDDCAADPACAAAYPDLEAQLYALVSRLNAAPVAFEYVYPPTGEPYTETVDGATLLDWMITDALYDPAWPPHKTAYLPLLIDQAERGNTDLLYPWLDGQLSRVFGRWPYAWGLYFAVKCQGDYPAIDAEMVAAQAAAYPELDGYTRYAREFEICDLWNLPASESLVTAPIESDIPTLILAGTYDPVTPPEWSRAAAEGLSNSTIYEFPSAGHSVSTDNPCAVRITAAFLNDPTTTPDAGCMADVPGPEFVLPQDIIIVPSVYELHHREIGYTQTEETLFLGSVLVLLVEIGFVVIAGIVLLVRRRRHPPSPDRVARFAHPLAGLIAVLNVGSSLAFRSALRATAAAAPYVLRFGLPTEYRPLLVVVLVAAILTAGLVIVAVLAWVRRYWSVAGRIFFSLVTAAAIVFAGLMGYWGLYPF